MAQFDNIFPVDLENGPSTVTLKTMYSNNKKANRVGFKLTKKGQPVTIEGSCVGTAILSNDTTVPIDNGVVSGNEAYVVLPDACYSMPGPVTVYVTIVNSANDETATLLAAAGYVRITETDTIIDPGTILPSVTTLIDLINEAVSSIPADYSDLLAAIAPTFSTSGNYAIGDYVWHSGKLYRFSVPHAAGSWTGSDAIEYTATQEYAAIRSSLETKVPQAVFDFAMASIAPEFSSATDYTAGQWVWRSGRLYRFTADHAAGEWSGTDAVQAVLANDLGGKITALKSAIKQESEASGNDFLEFLPGFIDCKGTSTATDTENRTPSASGICSAVATCSPGDQFTCTLYGAGNSSGGARAYAFLNSAKKAISGNFAAPNTTLTNQTITAPSGAAYCVFNSKPDNGGYYVIAGDTIEQKHVALEKKVELVNKISTQSTASEWESGSLASSDGSNTSNAARIRTVTSGINAGIRSITANDGYTFCVYGWNGNSYIGVWTGSAFDSTVSSNANYFQSMLDILPCFAVATKIRLVVKRKDGASMTVNEGANILYLYDETLHAVKEVADEAKDAVEKILFNACVESMWENGTLLNGSNSANNARLRTKTYLPEGVRKIIATNGYEFVACAYNKQTGAYEGIIKANGTIGSSNFVWHTSVDITDFTAYKFRLVLRNSNDTSSDMDVSESANCLLMSYTDGTLSFSGAPADALTVGERLNTIETGMRYGHFSVKRNNPTYVTQMLNLAQGYMAANSDPILRNSKHFQYGNNSILGVSSSTNLIDCSTFVGLVIRGYGLSETSYMADVPLRNPANWVAKSGVPWAIDPFDWKNISKPGESPSRLRWAAQLAQWMEERGQVVPMDSGLADVMPGDILFWAKKTSDGSAWVEPKRYKHISHVGFCLSRTKTPANDPDVDASVYPYKHMTIEVGRETYDEDETTILQGCVKSKLVEYEPADSAEWETTNNIHTLVLVCRPDLGSI